MNLGRWCVTSNTEEIGGGAVEMTESYFSVFMCKTLDEYFFNFSKHYFKKLQLWLRSKLTEHRGDQETRGI